MPGRDYTRAYARLEESLGGTAYPSLNSSKRLRPDVNASHLNSTDLSQVFNHALDERSAEELQRSPLRTEVYTPSPPQTSYHIEDPTFGLRTNWRSPEISLASEASTPVNHGSSVTPNTTPPSLGSHAQSKPQRSITHASSHADSFTTAQEDATLDDQVEDQLRLPFHGTSQPSQDDDEGLRNFGWGIDDNRRELSFAEPKTDTQTDNDTLRGNDVEERRTQERPLPNVTIRKKRRPEKTQPTDLTFLEDGPQALKEVQVEQESPSSWFDGSAEGGETNGRYSVSSENLGRASSDLDLLRSGSHSQKRKSTPVVEARIVSSPQVTPPRQQRPLRHIHKHDVLRDGSSEAGSPEAERTNRQARDQSFDQNKRLASTDSAGEAFARSPTPPDRATDPRNNLIETSPISIRSTKAQRSPQNLPQKSSLKRRHESLDATMKIERAAEVTSPGSNHLVGQRASRIEEQLWSSSAASQSPGAYSDAKPTRARETRQRDTVDREDVPDRGGKVFPRELQYLAPLKSSDRLSPPTPGSIVRRSADPHTGTHSSALTYSRTSPFSEASDGMVLQDAQTVSIFPHNNKSLVVVEHPRSAVQSRDHAEDFMRLEQDELKDDDRDADEQDVEMVPSNWVEMTRLEEQTPVEEVLIPAKPSTPRALTCANFTSTDSPLTNPRSAPEPPAFSISVVPPPAATNAEHNDALSGPFRTRSRRNSLLQRARTYSGHVIQPFISYTEKRRSARFDKRNSSAPAPDPNISAPIPPPHEDVPQRHSTLHTHWQPRDYWNSSYTSSSNGLNSTQHPTADPLYQQHHTDFKGHGQTHVDPNTSVFTTPATSTNASGTLHGIAPSPSVERAQSQSQHPSRQTSLLARGRTLPRRLSQRATSAIRRTSSSRPFSFVSSNRASGVSVSERDEVRLHQLGVTTALPPHNPPRTSSKTSTGASVPPSSWPRRNPSGNTGINNANSTNLSRSGLGRRFSLRDFMDRASSRGGGSSHSNGSSGIGAWSKFSGVHTRDHVLPSHQHQQEQTGNARASTMEREKATGSTVAGTLPGRLTQSLRVRMRERSQRREERERQEQRDRLRDSIGMKIFVPE